MWPSLTSSGFDFALDALFVAFDAVAFALPKNAIKLFCLSSLPWLLAVEFWLRDAIFEQRFTGTSVKSLVDTK